MLLTDSARHDLCFILPSVSALGAKKIQGVCLASSFHEGCVEIKGSGSCPSVH